MKHIIFLLPFLLLIISCSGDERLEMKSKDVKPKDLVKDKVITNDERLDYIAYKNSIWLKDKQEDAKLDEEIFSSVLDKAKKYKADIFSDATRKKDLEYFQMYRSVAEMRDKVDVILLSAKKIDRYNWKIKVNIINVSNETIETIKGEYYIFDKFQDYISDFKIRYGDGIPPKDTVLVESEKAIIMPEEGDALNKGLKSENFKDLEHYFWPEKIVFASGKFIERNNPDDK